MKIKIPLLIICTYISYVCTTIIQYEVVIDPSGTDKIIFLHDVHLTSCPEINLEQALAIRQLYALLPNAQLWLEGCIFKSTFLNNQHNQQLLLLIYELNTENFPIYLCDQTRGYLDALIDILIQRFGEINDLANKLSRGLDTTGHVADINENMTLGQWFKDVNCCLTAINIDIQTLIEHESFWSHRKKQLKKRLQTISSLRKDIDKIGKVICASQVPDTKISALQFDIDSMGELLDKQYSSKSLTPQPAEVINDLYEMIIPGLSKLVYLLRILRKELDNGSADSLTPLDLAILAKIFCKAAKGPTIIVAGGHHCTAISKYLQNTGYQSISNSFVFVTNPALSTDKYLYTTDFMQEAAMIMHEHEHYLINNNMTEEEIKLYMKRTEKAFFANIRYLSQQELISIAFI